MNCRKVVVLGVICELSIAAVVLILGCDRKFDVIAWRCDRNLAVGVPCTILCNSVVVVV